jgi:hypothetical protein
LFGKRDDAAGKSKPSGMEMMIQNLLRSMGVEPAKLEQWVSHGMVLATQAVQSLQNLNTGQQQLQAEQQFQRELLLAVAEKIGVPVPNAPYATQQPAPLLVTAQPTAADAWKNGV